MEEKGAEHATQLLALIHDDGYFIPFGNMTLITCLMSQRASAWHRSSLLASCSPRMSSPPFNWLLTTKCHQFSWRSVFGIQGPVCSSDGMIVIVHLWMWYSTQLVITSLVHLFIDSMALMICKEDTP